jgi:tetratricopeptide (TPR) repeat protein
MSLTPPQTRRSTRRWNLSLVPITVLFVIGVAQIGWSQSSFWQKVIEDGGGTLDVQPATPTSPESQEIHRGSSTEEILRSLDQPGVSPNVWVLAVSRMKEEGRLDQLLPRLERCAKTATSEEHREVCTFYLANQVARDGRLRMAANMLEEHLEFSSLDGARRYMMLNLAELKAALNDFDTARFLYGRLLQDEPTDSSASLGLALLSLKEGKDADARALMRHVLKEKSAADFLNNPEIFFLPEGDRHLVRVLFDMTEGHAAGVAEAFEAWQGTESYRSAANHYIREYMTALREITERRLEPIALPYECYPQFVSQRAGGAQTFVHCADQRAAIYNGSKEDGFFLPENETLPEFGQSDGSVTDVHFESINHVTILLDIGQVIELQRTARSWQINSRIDLGIERARAVQLLARDRVLLQGVDGTSFSITPRNEGAGNGVLTSVGNGSSMMAIEMDESESTAAISYPYEILFYEPATRNVFQRLTWEGAYQLSRVALSPDGNFVAVQTERAMTLYSIERDEVVDFWQFTSSVGVIDVQWAQDGESIIAVSSDGAFRLRSNALSDTR